jgi:hypothetical protein
VVFTLQPSDRPRTIAWFEWLSILSLAAEVAYIDEHWALVLPAGLLFLWIIFSISRGRSRVARLIWTGLTLLSFASGIIWPNAYSPVDRTAGGIELTLGWGSLLAEIVSLGLLWSVPTSKWLRSRSAPAPNVAHT